MSVHRKLAENEDEDVQLSPEQYATLAPLVNKIIRQAAQLGEGVTRLREGPVGRWQLNEARGSLLVIKQEADKAYTILEELG